MKDSCNFITIKIKLPKHLAVWLQEFSKQIAMQPDQVIATILTYYYEAWKAGFEKGQSIPLSEDIARREPAIEMDIEELAKDFIYKENIKASRFIIREFASWIKRNNISIPKIDKDLIEAFLKEYQKNRGISRKTHYVYKGSLRKFVEYLWQYIK